MKWYQKVWAAIVAFFKQLWSLVTDKDWDADAQKIVGILAVSLGFAVMATCTLKWDFQGQAPIYGSALITLGVGLLGWRGHTDV